MGSPHWKLRKNSANSRGPCALCRCAGCEKWPSALVCKGMNSTPESQHKTYPIKTLPGCNIRGVFLFGRVQDTMLLRSASVTASVRLATPNLERMLLTCDLMVDGLTVNLAAICVLFSPSIIRPRTSRSRSVRSRPGAGGWLAAWTRDCDASGESVE